MMVRFDTYDWTDSRIGWVRYESLITCRWISCSYLFNFTEQMEIFIEIWEIYTVYLKKMYFKVTEKCRSTIPSRSFVVGMGRYFCAFNKDWIVFSVPRFSSNDWLYWTLLKLTFQAQMSDWAKNEVILGHLNLRFLRSNEVKISGLPSQAHEPVGNVLSLQYIFLGFLISDHEWNCPI